MNVPAIIILNVIVSLLLYWFARYITRCEARIAIYHAEDFFLSNYSLTKEESRIIMNFTKRIIDEVSGKYSDQED